MDVLRTDSHFAVSLEGYQWLESAGQEYLAEPHGVPSALGLAYYGREVRWFKIEEPLVDAFAALTAEDILPFANQYGLLGLCSQPVTLEGHPGTWIAESAADWLQEIRAMRNILDLWRAVQKETAIRRCEAEGSSGLEDMIQWGRGAVWFVTGSPTEGSFHRITDQDSSLYGKLDRGDCLLPAWLHIREAINQRLADTSRVAITWTASPFGLAAPDLRSVACLSMVAKSLLGLLWLQLSRMVMGDLRTGRCEQCGEPFGGRKGAHVKSRRFCTSRCRAASNNEKKRQEAKA